MNFFCHTVEADVNGGFFCALKLIVSPKKHVLQQLLS